MIIDEQQPFLLFRPKQIDTGCLTCGYLLGDKVE